MLLAFAAVSLLVGSFVIWNTFNILVAQRRREVALLRAVGGTRRQILTGIITEAVIVGLAASGIGLVAGIGLATGIRSLLGAIGIEVPTTAAVVEVRSVIAALLVGVVVTVAAAAIPALAATRVAPIEALRQATPAAGRIGRTRSVTGRVLLTAGAAALAVATAASNQPLVAGIGTLLAFAGLVVAGPHLARAIARLASHGRPGGAWSLASRNVARTPQRSSATAMALAVGLAVVCAVSVTAASTKASVTDLLSGGNRADLILKPAAVTGGLSPAVADLLRHQAGVDTVLEMRFSGANVNNVPISIAGVKPDGLDKVLDIGVTGGSSKDFRSGTVLLSTKQATALNAAVGDRITVTFPETGAKTLTIAATFERDSLIGAGYLLTLDDYAANVTSRLNAAILVKSAMGADSAALKERVGQAVAAYPNVKVSDPAEFGKAQQGSVDQMMGLVTALLAMAIIVAILGIINTLMLSVVERTRELGLMRAVGATKRQVRGVIRRESVLMSLFGALAGVGLGSAAGIALTRSMADQGLITLSFPFGTLAVYLVVATLIGVLAAIGPASRASRVNVLTAITVD